MYCHVIFQRNMIKHVKYNEQCNNTFINVQKTLFPTPSLQNIVEPFNLPFSRSLAPSIYYDGTPPFIKIYVFRAPSATDLSLIRYLSIIMRDFIATEICNKT